MEPSAEKVIYPPRVDEVEPVPGCLDLAALKTMRVGQEVMAHGCVEFGYVEPGIRRGAIFSFPKPRKLFLVSYTWRNEGVRFPGTQADYYSGPEGPHFEMRSRVLVCVLRAGLTGLVIESLPQQVTIAGAKSDISP